MIISHTNKYIYLQPVGSDSHVGYVVLRNAGLVSNKDVCSGLFLDDLELYPAQNFKGLTFDEYKKKFGFEKFAVQPNQQIMNIINASLTLDELVELGYLTPKQVKDYAVFSFLREPIERFTAIFTESQIRRPILQDMLVPMFEGSIVRRYSHLLWQNQTPYHVYDGEIVSYPLLYNKFYYSIEKMVNNLGSSLKDMGKLKYTFSLDYSVDPSVQRLAEQNKDKLRDVYKEDIKLWEKLRDSI